MFSAVLSISHYIDVYSTLSDKFSFSYAMMLKKDAKHHDWKWSFACDGWVFVQNLTLHLSVSFKYPIYFGLIFVQLKEALINIHLYVRQYREHDGPWMIGAGFLWSPFEYYLVFQTNSPWPPQENSWWPVIPCCQLVSHSLVGVIQHWVQTHGY